MIFPNHVMYIPVDTDPPIPEQADPTIPVILPPPAVEKR